MLSYPADIPEIIRSHRKDEEYVGYLRGLLNSLIEKFLSPQQRAVWFQELELVPELLYFAVTTLPALQTLGEEYIGLVQVGDAKRKTLVPGLRRVAFVLTQVAGGYLLRKIAATFLKTASVPLDSRFDWTAILEKFGQVHLAVFFLSGAYYHIAKRLFGVRYLSLRPQASGDESTYRLLRYLGITALVQVAVHSLILLYRILPKKPKQEAGTTNSEKSPSKSSNSVTTDKPDSGKAYSFSCAFCLELSGEVACLPCGHLFCWDCSLEQATATGTCGLCRQDEMGISGLFCGSSGAHFQLVVMLLRNCVKFSIALGRRLSSSGSNVVFTGIQPTGTVHLGNYLGAIANWVEMQKREDVRMIVSIVDWHSLTLKQGTPEALRGRTTRLAASLLACGIEPSRTILFKQSSVPQHTELAWLFNCIATIARLRGTAQFKDKASQFTNQKGIPVSLLTYPILQSADILLYRTNLVPVGEDQVQHIQIAQHLATAFNSFYTTSFFPFPQPVLTKVPRIKSLRDPSKKMSKSDPAKTSCIVIQDSEDNIRRKVKKAVTDFTAEVTYEPHMRPGVSNLVAIHSGLSKKTPEQICNDAQGLKTGEYKDLVAECIIEHLTPIREKYYEILEKPEYIQEILDAGSESAKAIAEKNMDEIKAIIGMK